MPIFEPRYPINMFYFTQTLKGMAVDCRMGRFSWTVHAGCNPKGPYQHRAKEKKEICL